MSVTPNKTVWFFTTQVQQVRRIWAQVYGAKAVRREQWLRALVTAIDALVTVAPFVEDKDASLVLRQRLDELEREVNRWRQG